jgi:hypothetical protein
MAIVVALKTETGGGVRLGVAIDKEGLEAFYSEACGEVDGCRGLADSAFLVNNAEYLPHGNPE